MSGIASLPPCLSLTYVAKVSLDLAAESALLHQMIQSLRGQLERSIEAAKTSELKFKIETIDLELKIVATAQSGVEGGIGWSVFKFGAKKDLKDETVHTLRLKLTPQLPDGDHDPLVSGRVSE